MYTKIDEYKDTLKSDEQQYDVYIVLEDGTTVDTDISGFKIISNLGQKIIGNFVARRIEFNLFNTNLYNITNKEFEAFVGLKVNGEFNYISLGKFIANKPEVKDEKTDECSITAQDYSLKFKVKYEPVITFPCTVSSAIQQICSHLGITYKTNSFINADYMLEEFFIDEEATFFDVIKTLVEAGFANAYIDNSNSLIIKSPKKTSNYSFALNEIFELQKQDNKFGPLNAVVASRVVADDGSTTEDVYARNEQSITQNGIYEYKIIQNDAIDYDRQTAVDNMLTGILDFQYVPATIETVYNPAMEVGDLLEVPDVKTDTSFLLYAKEITADLANGLMTIESSEETQTETDYKAATVKDKRKKTEYKVNKMEGKITQMVSSVEEIEQELVLTSTTEEGKTFYLTDSADNYCKSVEIFGESTQETRSGKNYLNVPNEYELYEYKFNVPLSLKSGTYILSAENVVSDGEHSLFQFTDVDGEISARGWLSPTQLSTTVVFPKDIVSYSAYSQNSYNNSVGKAAIFTKLMLSKEGGEYEPYGQMPSPEFPSEIESMSGKNLINILAYKPAGTTHTSNGITFTVNGDGTITANGTATADAQFAIVGDWFGKDVITALDKNKSYKLSGANSNDGTAIFLRSLADSVYTTYSTNSSSGSLLSGVENIVYIAVQVNSGTTLNDYKFKPMLEAGNVATFYVPYNHIGFKSAGENGQESIVTIPLLHDMRSLPNSVRDEIQSDEKYDIQKVKQVVFNGSESGWTIYNETDGTGISYGFAIALTETPKQDNANIDFALSNYFKQIPRAHLTGNDNAGLFIGSGNYLYLKIPQSMLPSNDINELKRWLAENNVEVIYELAEPIVTEITDEVTIEALESIRTFKGVTNIEADAPSILTYYTSSIINQEMVTKGEFSVTNEQIKAEVRKKVGEDEIIAKINLSAEQAEIDANKISLKRKKDRLNR